MSGWRELLDPELEHVLDALPVVDFVDYQRFRAASDAGAAARAREVEPGEIEIADRKIGPDGRTVSVRLYRPPARPEPRPAVLHLHGGGFVSGSSDAGHARNVELSRELGAVVVSVDYRRAPEHPYPAPLDDCETALRWLIAAATDLGVDPGRIALHGVSAGGALAAGLAIRVRGELAPCFQFLSVPITDDRLATASMLRYDDTPIWSRPVGEVSWAHYLGDLAPGSADVPAEAAPGRASIDDLRGLPPAYVAVMELDPLCDEGLAYGAMLAEAGVAVEAHRFPGAFHAAFTAEPSAGISRRYLAEEIAVLARALGVER
ncbi:alpha/beta hydrolase [Rhodococcus sp. NCIMB 12038]|uniref:alpha/beta hydrolase n=1 Tax=Rhodococcus sp. NCIMB 12038 TaxID=933800 RepID=UPI000B3D3B53|nr:alpha/beta hydrolase [Rhodococcus sp. NCIMB 12038]OUS90667.1 hypothetical protein CA951_34140 [Rhodococcus sp. NCIMB 12038]